MSYRGTDEVVWALEERTGRELWKRVIGNADRRIGYDEGSRCTPTVEGDRIWVLGAGGVLACLENATGQLAWKKDLKGEFGGRMMSDWGFSESPLVVGDQVFCTPGGSQGTVLCLNKMTGAKIWQSGDLKDSAAYSSLVKAAMGGVPQVVQLTDAHVVGVGMKNGAVLWSARREGQTAVIPTPIVEDNFVYVTSGYGAGCNLLKISGEGERLQAEQVYANKVMVNHHGGVILLDGYLYGYSEGKGWVCQEFDTGKMVWSERNRLGKGALTYADGHFYLRFEGGKGTMVLIEATPTGFKETGRFDQPERSRHNAWPHPVIANGKLYLRDQDLLFCYDVKS